VAAPTDPGGDVTAAAPAFPHPSDKHGFTVADLYAIPEDGLRYELIDGRIVVSPSATLGHNAIAWWIANALDDAYEGDEYLVSTDASARINNRNEPRPDIVVVRSEHFNRSPFPIKDALLVGEVVSPGSVLYDTDIKRAVYARAGVPAYWIVVPDEDTPTIALAELILDPETGEYIERTKYTTDVFRTDHPWPVEVDLPALAARRAPWFRPRG
jgi:Uma2 family endonuclease